MALQSSGTIKMSEIIAEKGATAGSSAINISLRGLSVDGTPDYQAASSVFMIDIPGSPNQVAPYAMSEFYGYSQIQTHDVVVSFGSPQGKIGFRTGTITSGADVPFGTINLGSFSTTDNNNYVRMTWLNTDESGNSNSIPNRDWTSVELPDGTTFNRTSLTESGLTQGLFPATNAQYSSWGSGTWTFTYS